MFYICESDQNLDLLEKLVKPGCYVQIISNNDYLHPKLSSTVAVFVGLLQNNKTYIIPIDHPDGLNVTKERVSRILSNSDMLYVLDKKELIYHFPITKSIDIQLLHSMVNYEKIDNLTTIDTISALYNKHRQVKDLNKLVPLVKLHEQSEANFETVKKYIDIDIPEGFGFYNDTATAVFYLLEQQGLQIAPKEFEELFKPRDMKMSVENNIVYSKYNLYNNTSRPTNAFNSVNFAAIPKTQAHREVFTPQNDMFVEFDFDGYHVRLLCDLIGYELTDESAHKQLAKVYFGKDNISEEEYKQAKQINFHMMYGKIPEDKKHLDISQKIQKFIDDLWTVYQNTGKIQNPHTGKVFSNKLPDMNPQKLMNYLMQSVETSRNIKILKNILRTLKTYETSVALYTYDSVLFDFKKTDTVRALHEIEEVLSENGKYPVNYKHSKNLYLD